MTPKNALPLRPCQIAVGGGFDADDYSVVVKSRARPPAPWRWEIYRAGRRSPIAQSDSYFELSTVANVKGKAALAQLLERLRP